MKEFILKFILDSDFDAAVAWRFYRRPRHGGVDFWLTRAIVLHDSLRYLGNRKQPKKFLDSYVNNLYQEHVQDFTRRQLSIVRLFQSKKPSFLKVIKKIFPSDFWLQGRYCAYLSVFDFGARFLKDKSFQLFMYQSDRQTLFNIFHELLHFIFYDYAQTKHPQLFKGKSTEEGILWDLAELFNSVMHDTQDFIRLHGRVVWPVYPSHRCYIEMAKKSWQKYQNIDDWVKSTFDYLQKKS